MVLAPRDFRHLSHRFFDKLRDCVIVAVNSFTSLEIDIGILRCAADNRMIWVKRTAAKCVNSIPIENLCEIIIVNDLDLLNFMRGAESVKEVDKRDTPLDSNEMCHCREIHNLLHA